MSGHKSAFGSIFRNVSFLTVGRIVNALCSFVYTAFAVRALGLADFGLLILIHSLATTGSMLSRMQSWQTLIRYGSQAFSDGQADLLRRVTSFCVRLDFISAGCAVVFSLVATQIYAFTAHWSLHDRLMADLYVCVAPFMYTGWCNGVLRMAGKFHLVPVSDTCTAVVRTLGVLLGFFLGFKLAYFLCVWAVTIILDYGLYIYFALSVLRTRYGFRYFRSFRGWGWSLPGMWQFTRSTSINQTLSNISGHVATLLVGSGLGSADAAVFRVCRQIADGIVTPAQLLSPVLYPELVKMRDRKDWIGLKKVSRRVFGILAGISVILMALAFGIGSRVFYMMLHTHVSGTTLYIVIMLGAAICSPLTIPLEPLLIVVGQVRFLMRNRTVITAIYFPALYMLTVRYGLAGACLSTLACNAAILLSCFAGMRNFSGEVRSKGGCAPAEEPARSGESV